MKRASRRGKDEEARGAGMRKGMRGEKCKRGIEEEKEERDRGRESIRGRRNISGSGVGSRWRCSPGMPNGGWNPLLDPEGMDMQQGSTKD